LLKARSPGEQRASRVAAAGIGSAAERNDSTGPEFPRKWAPLCAHLSKSGLLISAAM
jgi:hypothetical protein